MEFAQRASASARRVGLALRATRERAILAVKNTASATTGPASANLAGRESIVTLVSCARTCMCVCTWECLIISCDILISMINKNLKRCHCCWDNLHLQLFSLTFSFTVTHDLDVVVKGNLSLFSI